MYERRQGIIDQLTADIRAAWPDVQTVVQGQPQETEATPYAVIYSDPVGEGPDSTPGLVDEAYRFTIYGRFIRDAGVTDEQKAALIQSLVGILTAGPNYTAYGWLPAVEEAAWDDLDEGEQPELEVAIVFTVHAYGARNGTIL